MRTLEKCRKHSLAARIFYISPTTFKLTYCDEIPLGVLDIDECVIQTDKCDDNAVCNNTQGFYLCTCKEGFYGSGKSCIGNYEIYRYVWIANEARGAELAILSHIQFITSSRGITVVLKTPSK